MLSNNLQCNVKKFLLPIMFRSSVMFAILFCEWVFERKKLLKTKVLKIIENYRDYELLKKIYIRLLSVTVP